MRLSVLAAICACLVPGAIGAAQTAPQTDRAQADRAQTVEPAAQREQAAGREQQAGPTSEATWEATVRAFAQSLISGDAGTLKGQLDPSVNVQSFSTKTTYELVWLMDLARHARLMGTHAYAQTPPTLASDIASDFQAAEDIPDPVKRYMIPSDTGQMQQANQTAQQWVAGVLPVSGGALFGAIVLWQANPAESSSKTQAVFILLQGRQTEPGQFRITMIVYGNPLTSAQ